jgi:hypothetical protein
VLRGGGKLKTGLLEFKMTPIGIAKLTFMVVVMEDLWVERLIVGKQKIGKAVLVPFFMVPAIES